MKDKDKLRQKLIKKQRKQAEKSKTRFSAGRKATPPPEPAPEIEDEAAELEGEEAPEEEAPGPPTKVYRLRLQLVGIEPPIERVLMVPNNMTLDCLHGTIQSAMGWDMEHLYEFNIEGARYGEPAEGVRLGAKTYAAWDYTLGEAARGKVSRFSYMYDFGDSWKHEIEVQSILPPDPGERYPRLLSGKGACPPEDCGGRYRYQEIAEAFRRKDDPDFADVREEYADWFGEDFDPDAFDLARADSRLERERRRHS